MRLLLDTVTFIWAVSAPERISKRAISALQIQSAMLEISPVSISEIAIKQTRQKLQLDSADVLRGIEDLRLRILPYTADHALRLFHLPLHHPDPFDPAHRPGTERKNSHRHLR
ncbi:MAG: type II toxin-antitoxin system VapC family toxin [Acidobacteriaceae bacterium]|nr:type II toxin-antitoxin system VapC family toxin [Acidobacteriaceae bacterium]